MLRIGSDLNVNPMYQQSLDNVQIYYSNQIYWDGRKNQILSLCILVLKNTSIVICHIKFGLLQEYSNRIKEVSSGLSSKDLRGLLRDVYHIIDQLKTVDAFHNQLLRFDM